MHKRKPRHNNKQTTKPRKHKPNTNPTPTIKKTIASTEVKRESETVLTRSVFLLHHIAQYPLISNTQSYTGRMQISPITATSFHRLRKFTRARHMWLHLEPDWNLLWNQLYTEWPGIHTYDEINDRLFVNPGRNENILDVKSKMGRNSPEYWQWMGQIDY